MARVFYDGDADLNVVQQRNVAVLASVTGGNVKSGADQGLAQALSLRDSGVDVRMGLPVESAAREMAEAEGLRVVSPYEACEEADLVVLLGPGLGQCSGWVEAVQPNLVDGDALLVSDGSTLRFGNLELPDGVDVCLVSPAAADRLRDQFCAGRGVPVLVAVEQDASGAAWDLTLSYAKAIGGTRAGAIQTTVAEQVEARLFAEHVVRGGAAELVRASLETLLEAGHQSEVAYLACIQQLQDVTRRLSGGPTAAASADTSDRAAYGELLSGRRVVEESVRLRMREVLSDIGEDRLERNFAADQLAGTSASTRSDTAAGLDSLEVARRAVRELTGWPDPGGDQT